MSTDGGSAIEVAATGAAAVRLSLRGTTESSDPSDAPFLVEAAEARRAIRTWTRYEPTPVVALPELARRLGVRAVSCKDESGRFGLGSFKALGGAYAVLRVLQDTIERHTGERPTGEELRRGHPLAADVTTTTASAGNHGRSVAWGSEQLGCGCVVVLPADAVPARAAAIESHGARVERFDGGYDGAVAHVQERATEEGWVVVSDTAYPGYEKTPQRIMEGYTLIADELVETLEREAAPPLTHLFIQGGVGGLASGVCGRLSQLLGAATPRFVIVEPWKADCFGRGLRAGRLVVAEPPFETEMGGLAAGVPSTVAWTYLRRALDAGVALKESAWRRGTAALASGELGGTITAGPSGAAGVGALLELTRLPSVGRLLDLTPSSHIGCIATETRFE